MKEMPEKEFMISTKPEDIPNLVSFWNFSESHEQFVAKQGEPYVLQSQTGTLDVVEDVEAPFGGKALLLKEGQWLSIPRQDCPGLDIHGKEGNLTVIAWIKRGQRSWNECEFIAGQWNETNRGRQYGLFLNIPVWGKDDRICGHLSNVGGPTPGYKNCMDGPMGETEICRDAWSVVAMSYDGQAGYAWLNGTVDARPGLNPYPMAGGIHDGGLNGSDFTVGSAHRLGVMGNFFCGHIAGLAVYNRALMASEMFALASVI